MNKTLINIDDEVMSKLTLTQLPLYAQLMEHTGEPATISFATLAALTAYQPSDSELIDLLLDMNARLFRVSLTNDEHGYRQIPAFTTFIIDTPRKQVNVTVNPEWPVSRITVPHRSKEHPSYVKNFYRLFTAHSTHGVWKVTVEEIRRLLGVPDTYSLSNLVQIVLIPTVRKIQPVVQLTMKRVYRRVPGKQGQGNLVSFEFYSTSAQVKGETR